MIYAPLCLYFSLLYLESITPVPGAAVSLRQRTLHSVVGPPVVQPAHEAPPWSKHQTDNKHR
jgi:hypothetical protein